MASPHANERYEGKQPGETRLPYALIAFVCPKLGVRHVMSSRESGLPLAAPSLYEVHIASGTDSQHSRVSALRPLLYLYAWVLESKKNIDRALLTGEGLPNAHVRAFAAWIKSRWVAPTGIVPREHRCTYNAIIDGCSRACRWFVEQYALLDVPHPRRSIQVIELLRYQRSIWRRERIRVTDIPEAEGLRDDEIEKVEYYLKPQNRGRNVGETKALRDYLIWRLAIEFGLRRGEILALRTCDCPSRASPYFQVQRIEERGKNWVDPAAQTRHVPRHCRGIWRQ